MAGEIKNNGPNSSSKTGTGSVA